MKGILKILFVTIFFLLLLLTNVNASEILMNLEDYTSNNSTTETYVPSTDSYVSDAPVVDREDNSPKVTSNSKTDESEILTVQNVLSIIIIVIGILLIFLAVAILIRFK